MGQLAMAWHFSSRGSDAPVLGTRHTCGVYTYMQGKHLHKVKTKQMWEELQTIFFLVKNSCFHFWHTGKCLRSVGLCKGIPLTLYADLIVNLYVCKTSFVVSFVICMPFCFFLCLIILAEISSTVLNRTSRRVHLCLSPDLRGKSIVLHN